MRTLLEREKLLRNFNRCANWEEKYLYIIELGEKLSKLPNSSRQEKYSVSGCQSQVWIVMEKDSDNTVHLQGDSDTAIVKGLIALVFSLYHGMTPLQVIEFDIRPWFEKFGLTKHLTISRSRGLETMIRVIRSRALDLC